MSTDGLSLGPRPGPEQAPPDSSDSQLGEFVRFCQRETGRKFADHAAFHTFSVLDSERFWLLFLEWSRLLCGGSRAPVRTSDQCEAAEFFPNLRFSYTDNLLRAKSTDDGEAGALVACHAGGPPERVTRAELAARVGSVATHLRALGVGPGDRVVAVAGNNAEVVVAALAATSVGATFSSAAPEMGVPALLTRFAQLEPAVLVANLIMSGATGPVALRESIDQLVRGLPSLRALIALDDGPMPKLRIRSARFADLLGSANASAGAEAPCLPFNHPLFVLFSSGTTGQPKCIVHGAGGTLLEHVKEHRLHLDLKRGERLFFHTSAAWMMWNWQVSALASGAEIVLYDGPISGPETLWELVLTERVNVFGTSPPYLQLCEDSNFSPGPLPHLRTVLSTGSILHDWQYDWVSERVGPVALQSISGGTDIIGCFVLGHPDLPVRRGRIQCRSLGLDVQVETGEGDALADSGSPIGELVCRNPFPSRPLGFFADDGEQFHAAYFAQHPGVWTHGDLIEFDSDGQARMHGRSDGVLNVGAARIGPAEIYRALHGIDEIDEALAVELSHPDGERSVTLLVVLRPPVTLDPRLVVRIRREITANASAAHVPALVVQVEQLPATHSGKRSERAARDVVNGRPVGNPHALANPQALEQIRAAVLAAAEQRRQLEDAAGSSPDASTESRVLAVWQAILGVALERDDNFFELGGTSLTAVRLLQAIQERLGVELPPAVFINAQTPAQMAAVIDGPADQQAPVLMRLREGSGGRPVFLLHSLGGDVLHLRPLMLALRTERPVYGLQAQGLDPRATPQTTVEEMAGTYVEAVRSVQPSGPYALAGYSFGGLVAFEMACRLSADGEQVESLALIDTDLHHACLPALVRWRFLAGRPFRYLRYALAAPRTRIPLYVRKALISAAPQLPIAPPPPDQPLPPRMVQLTEIGRAAFAAYRPRPYRGHATLFLARTRFPRFCNPIDAWRHFVRGGLSVEQIDGTHLDLVTESQAGRVAERLSALL